MSEERDRMFENMDVEQSWNEFKKKDEDCVDKVVPYQAVKTKNKRPWFRVN